MLLDPPPVVSTDWSPPPVGALVDLPPTGLFLLVQRAYACAYPHCFFEDEDLVVRSLQQQRGKIEVHGQR